MTDASFTLLQSAAATANGTPQMKAMRIHELGPLNPGSPPLVEDDLPVPVPGHSELLVKVHACGVCHTDIDEIEGRDRHNPDGRPRETHTSRPSQPRDVQKAARLAEVESPDLKRLLGDAQAVYRSLLP